MAARGSGKTLGGSARPSSIRVALAEAVQVARDGDRMSPGLEVQALIADKLAFVVDSAEASDVPRAVAELQRAVALLPLGVDAPCADPGGVLDERGRVLELLDRPAQ